MFGDKLIVGTKIIKLEEKGRLTMPTFTYALENDHLVLEIIKLQGETTLKFSLYNEYLGLANRLSELRKNAKSLEEFNKYTKEIENICLTVAASSLLDKQRRFQISKQLLAEIDYKVGDELLARGAGKTLLVQKKK